MTLSGAGFTTLIVSLTFAFLGGVINLLLLTRDRTTRISMTVIVTQLLVSLFTGALVTLMAMEANQSTAIVGCLAGLAGVMGENALEMLKKRLRFWLGKGSDR